MRRLRIGHGQGALEGRSRRVSMSSRMRYRLVNELEWRAGTVENVSASGMMFRVQDLDGLRDRDTPLELSFTAPSEIGGHGDTPVFCRAYIKRVLPAGEAASFPAVAVRITEYMVPIEQRE